MEVRVVDRGGRSSLYVTKEGDLYRQYHDTAAWHGPLSTSTDSRGVERCAGNRRLHRVVGDAWESSNYRGTNHDHDPGNHRGVTGSRAPEYLQYARDCIRSRPATIEALARACGVEISTAWSYACRVVEYWPDTHQAARYLVYPGILECCERNTSALVGSLRTVMEALERMDPDIAGDTDWRCVRDRYAHLRLARLCVQAAT